MPKKTFSITVPEKIEAALNEEARALSTSRSAVVRYVLLEWLKLREQYKGSSSLLPSNTTGKR